MTRFALSGLFLSVLWVGAAYAQDSTETAADSAVAEDDKMPPPGYVPGHRTRPGLGLSPHAPQHPSVLPGALMPAFGAPRKPTEGASFKFEGYAQAGARVGLGSRNAPTDEQSGTTWHGDPLVPRGNVFEATNNVPYTWAELRFLYSTPAVTATVSIGAWSLSESGEAANSFMPHAQEGIRQAFLSYQPRGLDPVQLEWKVGAYEDTYGAMAQYDTGRYGTPLIATIKGVGETLSAGLPLGRGFELKAEHGIKTNLSRPPADAPTGPSHNWAKPWEGQTFVNHAHLGLDYKGIVQPALHYITAVARDDIGDNVPLGKLRAGVQDYDGGIVTEFPELDHADATMRILGADARVDLKRFGYLVVGGSHTSVEHVRTINDVIQVLYSGGGRDLMDRYFGRNNDEGKGTLFVAGAEYSVSLGTLLRYPEDFWGDGPDLNLSIFGMYGHITSDDPAHDGEDKFKIGIEGTYSAFPVLAFSGRIDRSVPYLSPPKVPLYDGQNDNSFTVLTAKAVFRSDWQAREALTLQYSKYFYRSDYHLVSRNAGGQISSATDEPDQHLFALYGTLWW